MAKPAKPEFLKKPQGPALPKGGGGDDGDNVPWRNWPSTSGTPDGRSGCCRPDAQPWNGEDEEMVAKGYRKFLQIRFSVDEGIKEANLWWVACIGNCPIGTCSFRHQMYRCDDENDDHDKYDYILGFRCECKAPRPCPDPPKKQSSPKRAEKH